MYIVSIDIGIINLGLVGAYVDNTTFKIEKIDIVRKIDITILRHLKVHARECKLYHSNEICDRVDHFLQEYKHIFDAADIVLLERQPPGGIQHVEQLLMRALRKKTILVAPTSLHKWMNINDLDYDARKVRTVRRAEPHLSSFHEWTLWDRKHDMADAFCILEFYLSEERIKFRPRATKKLPQSALGNTFALLDTFKFIGK